MFSKRLNKPSKKIDLINKYLFIKLLMEKNSISVSQYMTSDVKLLPDVGNVLPYQTISEILFGCLINEISRIELLNKGFVVNSELEDNHTLYFKLSKLEDFILFCQKKIDFNNLRMCPVNFFVLSNSLKDNNINPNIQHLKVMSLLNDFKEYIKLKSDIHSQAILKYYWNDIFNGIVTSFNEKPYLLTIKFKKFNENPYILNISESKLNSKNTLSLELDQDEKNDQFEIVYNSWVQDYLMDNPENYVISCLELITGSIDMARMIYKSHSKKLDHEIFIDDLNQIIQFKNISKKNSYLEYFEKIYHNSGIYQVKNDKLYLNFEGFNKYLLNLDSSYLLNFEEKESINQMYYNIMDELINSYLRLYKHSKFL